MCSFKVRTIELVRHPASATVNKNKIQVKTAIERTQPYQHKLNNPQTHPQNIVDRSLYYDNHGIEMPAAGRVSDKAQCNSDAHGCIACAHTVIGPAIQGSPDVVINSLPALRVGDPGLHAVCCGTNTWQAAKGAQTVQINGKSAYRKGDKSQHCGGVGKLIEGSGDVIVGDSPGGGGKRARGMESPPNSAKSGSGTSGSGEPNQATEQRTDWIEIVLLDENDDPVPDLKYEIELPSGDVRIGTLNKEGKARLDGIEPGVCKVCFPDLDQDAWAPLV